MSYIIKGETGDWEIVVGLEVHCEVISKAKLFSGAPTAFGAEANTQVSFVDAGFPGMLPVINHECVEQAIKTGMGLNATVNKKSIFARKNYYYADLPNGYQISQSDKPIISDGYIDVDLENGETRRIGIERLHLEQDAGKLMHDQHPSKSFVDLNRAGVALMEIVSRPDIRSPEEAGAYLRELRSIVRYIGSCDGNMDEGSMRCDANVSVRHPGDPLGTRAEIKNVNSIRFVMQAIEYEAKRQVELLEEGGKVVQETRKFDSVKGITKTMRSKETAVDYRYFYDPDLIPLRLSDETIEKCRKEMPELPSAKKNRFVKDFGLPAYDAGQLVAEKEIAEYFEAAAKGHDAKKVANYIMGDLFATLNKLGKSIKESPVSPENLGRMVDLINDGTISSRIAKDVFQFMVDEGKSPDQIVEEKGLKQVTDTSAIEKIIDDVINENPDKVAEYRSGKDKLLGWFVGQTMKASKGKANPGMLNDLLKKKLAG
ncbi:MAG: Asp-tRNA(Asn)/Glu-tRNA(Gln) amidotransferase subunit GatB [Alphaproteobacteria bacterium]|nr:Asp-tRNA(Asn)/Glu-tRNA(Gln) amidotransferase subunit GatB [Alphaproteobacteria bacterium]